MRYSLVSRPAGGRELNRWGEPCKSIGLRHRTVCRVFRFGVFNPSVLHIPCSLTSVCPQEPLLWQKPRRFLGRKAVAVSYTGKSMLLFCQCLSPEWHELSKHSSLLPRKAKCVESLWTELCPLKTKVFISDRQSLAEYSWCLWGATPDVLLSNLSLHFFSKEWCCGSAKLKHKEMSSQVFKVVFSSLHGSSQEKHESLHASLTGYKKRNH